MAHPYHHSLSSVKKWGGTIADYQPIHDWFDQSKSIAADFRHRALRHHAEGIFMLVIWPRGPAAGSARCWSPAQSKSTAASPGGPG